MHSHIDLKLRYNNINLLTHIYRYFFNPSYRIIWLYRLLQNLNNKLLFKILKLYYARQCNKYQFFLDPETKISSGIIFPHNGPIIINPKTIIGNNCIIHPCTLIGGNRKSHGAPKIGNNVFIGHGCKIIGDVCIGDYVFIAPGAVITKSIPSDSIVGAGVNQILKDTGGKQEVERYQEFA